MRWYLPFFCVLLAFPWSATVFGQCTNVALGKPVTASGVYLGNVPARAVDGNCGTSWNSGNFAPQFIQIDLQGTFTINNINIMFEMSPNGTVNHQVLVSPDMVTWSVADVITGFYVTGQLVERCYSNAPLTNVRGVRISSLSSPSWIAIREMGVYTLSTPTTPTITPSGPTTFCAGGSVTLTSSAASSYLWSTGATTQSITVSTSGTYSVTTSQAPSCVAGSLPCTTCGTGTASTTVTVNPLPVVNAGTPQTACLGDAVNLTASGTYSSNATFQWTGPNGYSSTLENPSIANAMLTHSGQYSVVATDGGCQSLSSSTNVTVSTCGPVISNIINEYSPVTAFDLCLNTVTVSNPSPFAAGERALLIQMKGATIDLSNTPAFGDITSLENAGNYEFVEISAVNGNNIQFTNTLLNGYTISGLVQLITVPQYADVTVSNTLTCAPWDGQVGGVLVFEVSGTLTLAADIDVTEKGFRAGATSNNAPYQCNQQDYFYPQTSFSGGRKGEGIFILPNANINGRGKNANGGGGGNDTNSGGGGGGNGGTGGHGGNQWNGCSGLPIGGDGGLALPYQTTLDKVYLGGGGGGGHQNDGVATPGSDGGGLVICRSNGLNASGGAMRSSSLDSQGSAGDGSGGAGGGGTILIETNSITGSLLIDVHGGAGGDNNNHGPGGGGGGGLVWSSIPLPGSTTLNLTGGQPGFHSSSGTNHGATAGSDGTVMTGLALPESTTPWVGLDTPSFSFNTPCPGATLLLEGAWASATPVTFTWSGPAGFTATGQNASVPNFTQTNVGSYTLVATAADGCTTSDSAVVTILPGPTTQIDTAICDTGSYTLPSGQTVNVSGTYSDTLQTVLGCDSIITTQLAVIDCHPNIGCDLICNTDFEDTQVTTAGNFTLTNHANIPCWSTTAADAQVEVWGTGFNGVPAYSGNQFIELNATLVSTIYQDFQALPGSTVSISFAHRGRDGTDVMSVSIGPVGGPYVNLGTYSTGNTAWQYYTVPYTFPAIAQVDYSLRFNSISAAGGNPGVGNFLDAISITMPAIDATVSAIQPGCPQAADGAISLTVTGGTPPLSVAWSAPLTDTTVQVSGLTQGDYSFTITDTYGCEHTDTVTLTEQYLAAASAQTIDICTGETYTLPGGTTVSLAGTYIDMLQTTNGCDSIVSTELSLLPVHGIAATPVICDGESFMLPDGTSVTTSGMYVDTLTNVFGCDSIIATQLTVNPSPVVDVPVSICHGQSYLAEGAMQDVAGVYYDTLSTNFGCDSVIITHLTINPIIINTLNVAICAYDSVLTAGYWKSEIGTYNDTLQTPLGCDSLVVTVLSHYPSPVAAISVNNSCLDEPLLVQDASTISSGTVASWDWNFGNGATSTLPQPPSQLYPSAGVYTIDLIVWSDNGCVDSAQADVEIYPLPIASFSWDSACVGLPISFTDLSVDNGPYPITAWNWAFSDNQTSAQQNPMVVFGAAGPYSATLNVTTTVGCKADTTLGDALVYPEPVAVILPPDGHCLLDTAFFGDASTVDEQWGDTIVLWQWELENGITSNLQTPSHVFSSSGINTVDLTVETANGCSHSTSATVEVFARPIPAFSLSETEGCEPLTVIYMDQSTIAAPYSVAQWHWQLADGEVSTERSPSYTHSYHGVDGILPDTVPVTLWVVSANGCASINTVTSTIVVYPLPTAQFTIDPERANMVDPRITFTNQSTPNVTDWDWRFGDTYSSSEENVVYTYADTGTYSTTLTVATAYGCTDTAYSKVVIEPHFSFYVPNSFTPNGDRRNDVFRGDGEGYTDHFMSIFTRWGQEIYAGSGEVGWDGTFKGAPVEVGVYEYVITLRDWKGNARRYMGHVNLVR